MSKEQRNLPLLGSASPAQRDVDPIAVAHCAHWSAAFRLCLQQSVVWRSQRNWADLLGMSVGSLNTLLNADHHAKTGTRVRHLDMDMIAEIEDMAGNNAISQYLQMRKARQLYCQRKEISAAQELAELKAKVAMLERGGAA